MKPGWAPPASIAEAIALQKDLRSRVLTVKSLARVGAIAGIDVGHDKSGISHAAVVCVDFNTLLPLETVRVSEPTPFPYVPGLLSFREIPVILSALSRLKTMPDLFMVDGQGIAHPRRLGIAAHLGVLTDMPSIGVAKSRLTGRYSEPGPEKGDREPLMSGEERIGTVLRSKARCRPLFVSPGHKVDQEQALLITLSCLTKYRLPEPTRLADLASKSGKNAVMPQKELSLFPGPAPGPAAS